MKTQRWLAVGLVGVLALCGCSKKASHTTGPTIDTVGPGAVSDLRVVSADTASVLLGWTSPTDNGNTVASYELRYGLGSGIAWSEMTPVASLPAPKPPGQAESFRVVGLAMGTSYSFAIRSKDASGNESGTSNTTRGSTAESTVGADLIVSTKEDGIWYSLNAGRTWHEATVSDYHSSFGVLAADPLNRQVLYVSSAWASFGEYPYLYRSTDGGTTWSPLLSTSVFVQSAAVGAIAVAPTSSNTIYVGVRGRCLEPHNNCAGQAGGAYRSLDGGMSWQNISSGLPTYSPFGNVAVYSIAIDPTNAANISAGTFRNNVDTGFFYSTTSGSGWGRVQSNPPDYYVYTVAIDPSNAERILLSTGSGEAIYLAEHGADSYLSQVSTLGGNQPIVFDPSDSRYVYTVSQRSVDGGRTWSAMTLPIGAQPPAFSTGKTSLAVDPVIHEIYAAGEGGLYRSSDRGVTWAEVRALAGCTGLVVIP